MKPLTIAPIDIPLPERPRDTLAARLAELHALLDRSDAIQRQPEPLAS